MEIGNRCIFVYITWQRRCFSSNSASSPAGLAFHTSCPWTATAAGNQRQDKAASLVVGRHTNSSSEPKVGTGKKWAWACRGRPAGTRGDELTLWTCSWLYISAVNLSAAAPANWCGMWGALALVKGNLAVLLPAPPWGRDRLSHRTGGLEEKGHQAGSNDGVW